MRRVSRMLPALLLMFMSSSSTAAESAAQDDIPLLKDIKRIVFMGDSITQKGDYVVDFECKLIACEIQAEVINAGLSSETASQLTPGEAKAHTKAHGFPRPFVGDRLERTLSIAKPDLLVLCYGVNDSTSLPDGEAGLSRFTQAITTLHDTALRAGVKRVVVCTPPVYDSRKPGLENKPDSNLTLYTNWLLGKRNDGWIIADIHTPMRKALDLHRQTNPDFFFAKDGVHPDRAGHRIMADAIIKVVIGENVDQAAHPQSLPEHRADEIRELVRQKQELLFQAYMTQIGHSRPGVPGGPNAKPGLSIDSANQKAIELNDKIRLALSAN